MTRRYSDPIAATDALNRLCDQSADVRAAVMIDSDGRLLGHAGRLLQAQLRAPWRLARELMAQAAGARGRQARHRTLPGRALDRRGDGLRAARGGTRLGDRDGRRAPGAARPGLHRYALHRSPAARGNALMRPRRILSRLAAAALRGGRAERASSTRPAHQRHRRGCRRRGATPPARPRTARHCSTTRSGTRARSLLRRPAMTSCSPSRTG